MTLGVVFSLIAKYEAWVIMNKNTVVAYGGGWLDYNFKEIRLDKQVARLHSCWPFARVCIMDTTIQRNHVPNEWQLIEVHVEKILPLIQTLPENILVQMPLKNASTSAAVALARYGETVAVK